MNYAIGFSSVVGRSHCWQSLQLAPLQCWRWHGDHVRTKILDELISTFSLRIPFCFVVIFCVVPFLLLHFYFLTQVLRSMVEKKNQHSCSRITLTMDATHASGWVHILVGVMFGSYIFLMVCSMRVAFVSFGTRKSRQVFSLRRCTTSRVTRPCYCFY
jgi:hypothetical protein